MRLRRYWFSLGLSALFLGAIALRFWHLDQPAKLVFDEIYYVQYAVAYLTGEEVFDAHPPFAKYLIAIAIWLGETLGFRTTEPRVAIEGLSQPLTLSPLSFRWLNALVGATIPILVAAVAYELSHRRPLALLAGLFASLDGLLLVESRYALLHVYLVAFGLLGQWCFLKALFPIPHYPQSQSPNSNSPNSPNSPQWLLNAGLSFAAAISVKWNGLGYWLVPTGLWFIRQRHRWRSGLACLAIAPAIFYVLLWLPHLSYQTDVGFLTVHQQIVGFHQGMDAEAGNAHRYCSPWWSWPLMLRPIAYFFQKSADGPGNEVWRYSIQAMGNPVLWWLTTGAIALLCIALGWTVWQSRFGSQDLEPQDLEPRGLEPRSQTTQADQAFLRLGVGDRWVATYLVLNYAANWLPWVIVKRCTFIYHHLGAMCFGMMAVAFWCERGLRLGGKSVGEEWRWWAIAVVGAIALAFLFWLPIYLGLPLSARGLNLRLWLPTWI